MSDKKEKFVLVRAIRGRKAAAVGSVVELTAKQAGSPLFRNRVRKADVTLQTAAAEEEPGKTDKEPGKK